MAGRPRKPTALKILEGNRGKRPLNDAEPQPTRGIPILPRWLRAFPLAVKEWRREAKELDAMGVLTVADAGALAMRAYVGSQIQELAAAIKEQGTLIDVKAVNKRWEEILLTRKPNPLCAQLTNRLAEYRALGNSLGLDPAGRSRLKVDKPKPVSKFAGLVGVKRVQG